MALAIRRVAAQERELLEPLCDLLIDAVHSGASIGFLAEGGKLSPGWAAIFRKHPTRFLVGSDTWVVQRWETYPDIMGGYRAWLGQLPREVAERVAWRNGAELFGLR